MSKISITTLGDLVEFQRGYDLPKSEFKIGNVPVISSNGILGFHNVAKVKAPGITIGRSGTVGLPHFINKDFFPHNTSLFIKDFKGNIPKYIFYLMKTLKLNEYGSGSGVPTMNRNHLHPIKVSAHLDKITQQKIAKVLSDLDSKIELNNKINIELEAMAKTLYDYWFVQFDFPDANGKPYKTSGGRMVWNEELNREIPQDWDAKKIKKILKTELGGTPSTTNQEFWDGNIPWLNSGEIANFPIIKSDAHISKKAIESSATSLMPKGTIVLSITRHIRPSILAIDACANQSVVGIYESDKIKSSFLYPFIKNEVPRYMTLRTGAQQPHINKQTIDTTFIIIPNDNILNEYYKKADTLYAKIINNAFQNQHLASLRDWLLPMLMNGQVSVGEVAKEYEMKEEVLGMVAEPIFEKNIENIKKVRTEKSDAFLKKVMLGSHLIYHFYHEREFGHIKFMKLLYLCEQVAEMDLITNYKKAAAGPFDKKTLISIENYVTNSGWFKINKESYVGSNGKTYQRTFYTLTNKSNDYLKYFDNFFKSEKSKIEKLIKLFKGANSKKCEIVATTYYAWNELLKTNTLINDASLVKGFFDFHPQKGKNFNEVDVREELPWMRENRVFPFI